MIEIHRTRHPRHLAAGLVAGTALAALALTGCSSSGSGTSTPESPSSQSQSPSTVTSTATATTTTTAASGGGSTTGGGGAGGQAAPCAESQLRASIDPRPVSGSSDHNTVGADLAVIVDFQNTSSTACTLQGYPGAALVDGGKQIKQATRTVRGTLLGLPVGTNTPPTVTLQPGAYASAGIEGVNQQEQGAAQAGCDAVYGGIVVTPPNTRTPVPFDVSWPKCFSFTVHPVNTEKNPPS